MNKNKIILLCYAILAYYATVISSSKSEYTTRIEDKIFRDAIQINVEINKSTIHAHYVDSVGTIVLNHSFSAEQLDAISKKKMFLELSYKKIIHLKLRCITS